MSTNIRPRGSSNNNCVACGDTASSCCSSCNGFVCKDCKLDHECVLESNKPKTPKEIVLAKYPNYKIIEEIRNKDSMIFYIIPRSQQHTSNKKAVMFQNGKITAVFQAVDGK